MLGGHYGSVRLRYDKQSIALNFGGIRNNDHKFLFPLRTGYERRVENEWNGMEWNVGNHKHNHINQNAYKYK